MEEFRIYETNKRSLLKSTTYRILEIVVDTFVLSWFIEFKMAFVLSIFIEAICFAAHFMNERVWNKINYGREVYKEDR